MGTRHAASAFNDYTVLQKKAELPQESWWICADQEFHPRWAQEVLRMQLSPISRTVKSPILGWSHGG